MLPNDGKCHLDASNKYTMTNTLVSFLPDNLFCVVLFTAFKVVCNYFHFYVQLLSFHDKIIEGIDMVKAGLYQVKLSLVSI